MIRPAATLAVEVTLKMIMTSRMGRENSLDDMLLGSSGVEQQSCCSGRRKVLTIGPI